MKNKPPMVSLEIEESIWQIVEQVMPFAKDHPTAALSFLLGTATGVLMREKHDRTDREQTT